jgi:hypothetical protein
MPRKVSTGSASLQDSMSVQLKAVVGQAIPFRFVPYGRLICKWQLLALAPVTFVIRARTVLRRMSQLLALFDRSRPTRFASAFGALQT